MADRTVVHTPEAPAPVASYSQGLRIGNVLAVAGQGGLDPDGNLVGEDVATQTRQTLANIERILRAGGASFADVIQVRVFLADPDDFAAMNAVYAEFVTEPFPVRTTVYVGLPGKMRVEIDALAVLD